MPTAMRTSALPALALPLPLLLALVPALGCGAAPPPAAVPAPSPPATPAPPAAVDVPAEALPPHGTLLLGELHGTREIPAFVGRLVAAVSAREPVVLALEIPQDHGPAIGAFLASDGGPAARRALLAAPWWQAPYQDGRRSVAAADLLETIRALRAAGRAIEVVAIDHAAPASAAADAETREEAMAGNVIAARRAHPDAALIVHAGNLHTSKREVRFRPGFAWMAMRVAAAGIPLVSLDARYEDGTAWFCRDAVAEHCGVGFVGGRGADLGIRLEPLASGAYDGWFGVGPLTASPPAGRPELAATLDAQVAAAAASPQAVHAKARRAYAAKRYGECADLLATLASPDAGAAYDHACCLALAGRKDDALARLRYALAAGFQDLDHLEKDPDLASLRDDPRWPIKK
jgi:hypothetical protein